MIIKAINRESDGIDKEHRFPICTPGNTPQESLQLGIAHGALAMTTPGDTSMVSLAEVQKLAAGGNARVER